MQHTQTCLSHLIEPLSKANATNHDFYIFQDGGHRHLGFIFQRSELFIELLPTALAGNVKQSVACVCPSVCPSVCLHSIF